MEKENPRAVIGGNNPPDPIEAALAPYSDLLTEADNWLDGTPVANADQLKAVDELTKQAKAARKAIKAARDESTKPLHEAWKAAIDQWKPAEENLDTIVTGLVAIARDYKAKLASQQAEARRLAYQEAGRLKAEAEAASNAANAGDIEAQRQASEAKRAAVEAAKQAAATKVEVRGLRTVHKYEITGHRAALHWIAANDKAAMTEFIEAYVAKNHRNVQMDGVRTWTEKEAF